ncbi:hypothetical protein [Streptomyces sp. NPDC088789]|uniref:hypothetical protein n=1 Tax=Streptomyces sp. NPDC088789 TaxID=3365899 RepID=UPI00382DB024
MQLPDGIRKSVNVLLCLAAVAAIGWSGREIWQTLDARRQIDAGCADLVPAGRVLALDRAGGEIVHRQGEEGTIELDALAEEAQDCELFSEKAGGRWFFTGRVGVFPTDAYVLPDDPVSSPVDRTGTRTYPAQPLGGGITGSVDDRGVTVQLPCAGGELDGRPVTALWARAELYASGIWEYGQPSANDRDVLAETAVLTANNLAERLGCADRLPDPPSEVPALAEGPIPVGRAEGTCAWYRESGLAGREGFPDTVLESRVDDGLWDEACALVLSEDRARDVHSGRPDRGDGVSAPERPGDWYVALRTFLGEDARDVRVPRSGTEDPVPARPGTAGRSPDESVWWASSDCAGRPQIHTMTLAYGYDRLMAPRMERLFRAYVTEITERRDCADPRFPEGDTFRVR